MKCSPYRMIDRAINITYMEELKKIIVVSCSVQCRSGAEAEGRGLLGAWARGQHPAAPALRPRLCGASPPGGRERRGRGALSGNGSELGAKAQTWPQLLCSISNDSFSFFSYFFFFFLPFFIYFPPVSVGQLLSPHGLAAPHLSEPRTAPRPGSSLSPSCTSCGRRRAAGTGGPDGAVGFCVVSKPPQE